MTKYLSFIVLIIRLCMCVCIVSTQTLASELNELKQGLAVGVTL